MNFAPWKLPSLVGLLLFAVAGPWASVPASATQMYSNSGPFVSPWMTPTARGRLASPAEIPGKEYSHDDDSTTVGASTSPPPADAEQVIFWDGFGGAMDGQDYSGTRPDYSSAGQVDALANWYDALLFQALSDSAHLIFSVDDEMTTYDSGVPDFGSHLPSAGMVTLSNGKSIGGAGELSYELAGDFSPPSSQGLWASQASINVMPVPTDVDGVEIWGLLAGNGGSGGTEIFDPSLKRTKYSLEDDYASFDTAISNDAVSVWNYDGTPFLAHSAIVEAVEALLGTPADENLDHVPLIDVDAMMVFSQYGVPLTEFDSSGAEGPHDLILFSIRQIADAEDESGYYATGSEIFWLDAAGNADFLFHGGHLWDKDYALASLALETEEGEGVVDINALEAVAVVPEPSTVMLLLLGLFAMAAAQVAHSASGKR